MNELKYEFEKVEWGDATQFAGAVAKAVENDVEPFADVLDGLEAPIQDFLTTPMTTRAALLGAKKGRGFYHHERRGRIPMPPALEPEVSVWDHGTLPHWENGILFEPKYFSFFQDAPLAAYNPNHRQKWRAHELIHGAAGFFWKPDMNRFEMYVGARLNELVPVVHWYHFDEMFRKRCWRHLDGGSIRQWCQWCQVGFADDVSPERMEVAKRFAASGFAHFDSEISACREEIESGTVKRVERFHGYLDSSSDSVGYLKGHWNRMTAWSFGRWAEQFLVPDVDYYTSLDLYAEQIVGLSRELISDPITVDPEEVERLRARRRLQDVAYRTLLVAEWDEEGTIDDDLDRLLAPIGEGCTQLLAGKDVDLEELIEGHFESGTKLWEGVDNDVVKGVFDLGYRDRTDGEKSIVKGIASVLELPPHGYEMSEFVESEEFEVALPLVSRLAFFLEGIEHSSADEIRFAAFGAPFPHADQEGENFGAVPENAADLCRGFLRLNETLRIDKFPAGLFDDSDVTDWAGFYFTNQFRLTPMTQIIDQVLGDIENAHTIAFEKLEPLLETGLLIWLPGTQRE